MLTLIIEWNWDAVGAVATLVGIVITLLTVVFFAGKLNQKVTINTDNIIKLDDKIDTSVEKLDQKIDASVERLDRKIDKSVKRLDKKIDKNAEKSDKRHAIIMQELGRISGYLLKKQNEKPIALKNSPLKLTDRGKNISASIKAPECIDEVWEKILEDIASRKLNKESNPYDLKKACFDIGYNYTSFIKASRLDNIKLYAVKNDHELYDFDLIFSILIRERYFKEHEIDIGKP